MAVVGGHVDTGLVPSWQSYSYAWGPLVAVGLLALLVLLLRWAFSHGGSLVRPAPGPGEPGDYGLLTPVDAPHTYDEAVALQEELRSLGIGSTIAQTTRGLRVLVWPQHVDAARAVVRRLRGTAG